MGLIGGNILADWDGLSASADILLILHPETETQQNLLQPKPPAKGWPWLALWLIIEGPCSATTSDAARMYCTWFFAPFLRPSSPPRCQPLRRGLCNHKGLEPLYPIYQHALVHGSPDAREVAAKGWGFDSRRLGSRLVDWKGPSSSRDPVVPSQKVFGSSCLQSPFEEVCGSIGKVIQSNLMAICCEVFFPGYVMTIPCISYICTGHQTSSPARYAGEPPEVTSPKNTGGSGRCGERRPRRAGGPYHREGPGALRGEDHRRFSPGGEPEPVAPRNRWGAGCGTKRGRGMTVKEGETCRS